MSHTRKPVLLALAAVLACGLSATSVTAQTAGAGRAEPMTATVRAVDLQRRTLDLLTGVGYALRIRRVEVPAGVMVEDRGARFQMSGLTAGCLVRVGCRSSAAGMVASSIELLESPAPRGKP